MKRNLAAIAIIPLSLGLSGCVVVGTPTGQTYAQPYPPPPFQPQCQQMPGAYGQGPTISCTRPDGSVSTTSAPPPPPPPPPPAADQGYAGQPYPPPPPPGYNGGNGYGY